MPRFRCPQCQSVCQVDDISSGRPVTCASCGHVTRFMMSPAASASADAPDETAEAAEPPAAIPYAQATRKQSDRDDHDEDEDEDRVAPTRRKAQGHASAYESFVAVWRRHLNLAIRVLAVLRGFIWMICGLYVLLRGANFSTKMAISSNLTEQCSLAGDAAVGLIVTYIFARVALGLLNEAETIVRTVPQKQQ